MIVEHQHDEHEDCLICASCGLCREDLDEDDICTDCNTEERTMEYCTNPLCESQATKVVVLDEKDQSYYCDTCVHAFEMGQAYPAGEVWDIEEWAGH